MSERIILETPRLILRELIDEDADVYYRLMIDPQVLRYLRLPVPRDRDEALTLMRSRRETDYVGRGYGRWACVLKHTNEVVGWSGPRFLPEIGEPELGYRFLPEHWGQGLATEAGAGVLQHWFGVMGQKEIVALVDPANTRSENVVRKLGFSNTGEIEVTDNRVNRWLRQA